MRVAVIGLGGVGGYIAASFAKASIEVEGFARGAHLEAIQKHGLKIVEDTQEWSVPLQAKTLQEAQGLYDLVLFCTKSYDLQSSYAAIAPYTNEQTILLSFSNGVNNADTLRSFGARCVLDACIYILSHIETFGVIRKKGDIFAAVFGPEQEPTQKLAELFKRSHLRYKTPENILEALWKKYLFISAFATLTSYYDKSIAYVLEHHEREVKTLLEEIASIAQIKGVDLSSEIEKALNTAAALPYDASTSMHLDFQNNKPTELEALCAYIVQEGQKNGIKTPLMKRCYEKLV